jgi:hypothetical protein
MDLSCRLVLKISFHFLFRKVSSGGAKLELAAQKLKEKRK